MNTSRLIKSWRTRQGITIRDIDNNHLLSICGATYLKYENNPEKMPIEVLIEIVNLFNGTIEEFFNTFKQDKLAQ